MNVFDVFAWIFLAILVGSAILDAIFIFEARRTMRAMRATQKDPNALG